MAATQRQAATSGVFLSRFHFGLLSKKHASRDACNPLPSPPQLPPPTFQWEGGEVGEGERGGGGGGRPPSLGSQPLNQALSHPVNLKQSGFNSSCLSVPTLAKSEEAHGAEADRLRPRGERSRQDWGCSRGHISEDTNNLFIPCYSLLSSSFSFPAILQCSWRDGSLLQIAHVRVWCLNLLLAHWIEFVLFTNCFGALFMLRVIVRGQCSLAHSSE